MENAQAPPPARPPPAVEPPVAAAPPTAEPHSTPLRADAAELKKRLDEAFKSAEAKQDKDDKGGAAGPLPDWRKTGFKLTEEQAAIARDPRVQMARLMDYARDKPLRATLILLTVVSILVGDAIMIAKRLGVDEWLMINFDLGDKKLDRFSDWDRRGSGLSYLSGPPGEEKEVTDAHQAAAVDGKPKLPGKPLEMPRLSGGLSGIITPEEMREGFRAGAVGEIDGSVLAGRSGAADVAKAFKKTAQDDFRPYSPAAAATDANGGPSGVFFGEAGEALENFASLSNGASASREYKNPDSGAFQEVPKGVQGDDMVLAMIGDDFKKELKNYAKGGKWKMHKMDKGEKTVRHEMEGMSLTGNNAVLQLLQTKRSTDTGLRVDLPHRAAHPQHPRAVLRGGVLNRRGRLAGRRGQLAVPFLLVLPSFFLIVMFLVQIGQISREKIRQQFAIDAAATLEMESYADLLNRLAYVNGVFPHRIFRGGMGAAGPSGLYPTAHQPFTMDDPVWPIRGGVGGTNPDPPTNFGILHMHLPGEGGVAM